MKVIVKLSILTLALHAFPSSATGTNAPRSAVVQLFNWPFTAIQNEVCDLYAAGFSHVHVSPPQTSIDTALWWGRYQPNDFRSVTGPLGGEADFRAMVAEADRCGITIVADVVINHMANFAAEPWDLYYPRNCDRSRPLNSGPGSCIAAPDFFHNEQCIQNYENHCEVMYGRICGGFPDRGLPDLRTGYCEFGFLDKDARNYDPRVLGMIRNYLLYLQDLGVRAFRIDAAKHMHPAFLNDLLTDSAVAQRTRWVYGEIITTDVDSPTLTSYRHIPGLDFMDFPLVRSLQNAFAFGGYLGALENVALWGGALDSASSVSFVTNHDVWGNDGGLGFRFSNYQDELLAHMFVLGRAEGIAYVYSEYNDGPSKQYRWPGQDYVFFHRRDAVRDMLAFRTLMLASGENAPTRTRWAAANHLAFSRGNVGFVGINKSGEPWNISGVDTGLPDGRYIDALSGAEVWIQGSRAQTTIPRRWGVMLVRADLCPRGSCALQ